MYFICHDVSHCVFFLAFTIHISTLLITLFWLSKKTIEEIMDFVPPDSHFFILSNLHLSKLHFNEGKLCLIWLKIETPTSVGKIQIYSKTKTKASIHFIKIQIISSSFIR